MVWSPKLQYKHTITFLTKPFYPYHASACSICVRIKLVQKTKTKANCVFEVAVELKFGNKSYQQWNLICVVRVCDPSVFIQKTSLYLFFCKNHGIYTHLIKNMYKIITTILAVVIGTSISIIGYIHFKHSPKLHTNACFFKKMFVFYCIFAWFFMFSLKLLFFDKGAKTKNVIMWIGTTSSPRKSVGIVINIFFILLLF